MRTRARASKLSTRSSTSWLTCALRWSVIGGLGLALPACSSGGASAPEGGAAGVSAGSAGHAGVDGAATGGTVGSGGSVTDAAGNGATDLATDFGAATYDGPIACPSAGGALPAVAANVRIDDFSGAGPLNGRTVPGVNFLVTEQFDATANAHFDPVPAIESRCGAAALGAAHIKGSAADTGATFALVFSGGGAPGGQAAGFYNASATKGISFRAALGDPGATKLLTVQVNVITSQWDYTHDVIIDGTTWQDVRILWSELQGAPGAPALAASGLNQIVFPLIPNAAVDLYLDDIAFIP
jgi:hypothetical protein